MPVERSKPQANASTEKEEEIQRDQSGQIDRPGGDWISSADASDPCAKRVSKTGKAQTNIGKAALGRINKRGFTSP
jgi:hypothetical protein